MLQQPDSPFSCDLSMLDEARRQRRVARFPMISRLLTLEANQSVAAVARWAWLVVVSRRLIRSAMADVRQPLRSQVITYSSYVVLRKQAMPWVHARAVER